MPEAPGGAEGAGRAPALPGATIPRMFEDRTLRPTAVSSPAATGTGTRTGAISPWARLNLRRNPFGEPDPEEAGELVVAPGAEGLADRLRRPGAVQILGAKGRGKTACLRALGLRFRDCPYVYLPEGGPPPRLPELRSAPRDAPAILLDEAQRLPRRRRRRLFRAAIRRGVSLALASHEDVATELVAAGLDVETVVVAGLEPERLATIVERRLEWARLGPGPLPRIDAAACRDLVGRFGDDLRAVLDHLYEVYQAQLDETVAGGASRWRSAS